ncbi:MAG TPA: hypothetical protein VFX28_24565, partial [Methylomirabilota bacterium]|nr:hypothetical protein [Methylomirabilota bacterium]
MTDAELYGLYDAARVELSRYPGVVGVGLGLKERRGDLTGEPAFRVYVRAKRPSLGLPRAARLPARYKDVLTDVLVAEGVRRQYANEDRAKHDPVTPGITICNGRRGDKGISVGTLGFLAFISGETPPKNIGLVTNQHVLAANGGTLDEEVYQPDLHD